MQPVHSKQVKLTTISMNFKNVEVTKNMYYYNVICIRVVHEHLGFVKSNLV